MNVDKYHLIKDDEVPSDVIIPDDGWAIKIEDAIIVVNYIQFAEEPNPNGTYNVNMDYEVVEGSYFEGLDDILGETIMDMLEDAIELREYKNAMKEVKSDDE
jgi:hypothetical protein